MHVLSIFTVWCPVRQNAGKQILVSSVFPRYATPSVGTSPHCDNPLASSPSHGQGAGAGLSAEGVSPDDDDASLFESNIDFLHPFAEGVVLGGASSQQSADSVDLAAGAPVARRRSGSVVLGAASSAVATVNLHSLYGA